MILFSASYLRSIERMVTELPTVIADGIREFNECSCNRELERLRIKYVGVYGKGKSAMAELRTSEAQEKWCEAYEKAKERLHPISFRQFDQEFIFKNN